MKVKAAAGSFTFDKARTQGYPERSLRVGDVVRVCNARFFKGTGSDTMHEAFHNAIETEVT